MGRFDVTDAVTTNPDGSYQVVGATQGACPAGGGGDDTTALATAQLIYPSGGSTHGIVNNANMRDLASIFGRLDSIQPIPQPVAFPFCNGATVGFYIPRGGHVRSRFTVPGAFATGRYSGQLKCVSYGPNFHPFPNGWQSHAVKGAIVLAGDGWSAAHTEDGSLRRNVIFNDGTLLSVGINIADNAARVELRAGETYDFLLAFEDETYTGPVMLSWNFGRLA